MFSMFSMYLGMLKVAYRKGLRGSRAKVHQKFGKPRHIGDRRKARDETSQTIIVHLIKANLQDLTSY